MFRYNSQKVIRRDKRCVYCGSVKDLSTDHVIPISKRRRYGLSPREVHNYGNLVAACRICNIEKANMGLDEFFERHPEYKKNFLRNSRYVSERILSSLDMI